MLYIVVHLFFVFLFFSHLVLQEGLSDRSGWRRDFETVMCVVLVEGAVGTRFHAGIGMMMAMLRSTRLSEELSATQRVCTKMTSRT